MTLWIYVCYASMKRYHFQIFKAKIFHSPKTNLLKWYYFTLLQPFQTYDWGPILKDEAPLKTLDHVFNFVNASDHATMVGGCWIQLQMTDPNKG